MAFFAKQNPLRALLPLLALLSLGSSVRAEPHDDDDFCAGLAAGYCHMYDLQFPEAHQMFAEWQRLYPQDPMGPVSDAAAYLFSEFDRLHILEAEFFTNDRNFQSQKQLAPDADVKQKFDSQLEKTRLLVRDRLSHDPKDANAMFANILMLALRGDYIALIEKRNLAGLSYLKQARLAAEALLKSNSSCFDAYLAIGIENYLLGLRAAPVRWMLQLGGAQTDKSAGLENLRITAEKGHYLQPYARLLLAIAALRDHDRNNARSLLQGLARQFPNNRLYARELAQIP
jgi:hypothetical protein